MNMFVKGELVVLRNQNILDYVEDELGSDVRNVIEKDISVAENRANVAEYERDMAWDSIRNLEQACLNGSKDVKRILNYIVNSNRINRNTLIKMLNVLENDINVNRIEY